MSNYIIYTDSACDISPDILKKWNVPCVNLTFRFDGDEQDHSNCDFPTPEFYARMRAGGVAKTSAVNVETFKAAFEPILKEGTDLLYLGFSTGLSNTCNAGQIAANELLERYPERKIIVVDSLAASAGFGLLVYLAVQRRDAGASIEEVAAFATEQRPHMCHWFTVDDLVYHKRGGRISPAVALVGTVLGIKPVLHVDDEGHLINVSKARNRKAALKELANKYDELALDPKSGPIFISHGDCIDDANRLAEMIREKHGVQVELITDVGPVIGAHSGPGTLALFYLGKHK